jgi:hypothetical protein
VGDRGSHRFDETRVAAEELAERERAASTGASTGSTTKSGK